jgi:Flp pilus assembly protein TadD
LPLLQKAVRLDPDASPAWLALGILHYDAGRLDAALAALAQAVLIEPKNARAHNYLAATLGAKGWRDGAEAEFQRAVELAPDYGDAHFNLAVLYPQRTPPSIALARRHYQKSLDLGQRPDPLVEKSLAAAKD